MKTLKEFTQLDEGKTFSNTNSVIEKHIKKAFAELNSKLSKMFQGKNVTATIFDFIENGWVEKTIKVKKVLYDIDTEDLIFIDSSNRNRVNTRESIKVL